MRFPTRIFIVDSTVRVSAVKGISALVIAALLAAGAVVLDAGRAEAAPGDTANASGQYLSGTLLGASLSAIAGVAGETATSSGTTAQTNSNNLGLTVLGNQVVTLAGGIQIPLALLQAGVVGQYASAGTSGTSVGASGLISSTGAIGTGITPAPGVAPGPLTTSLGGIVQSLGLPSATTNELANLGLTVAPSSANATQTAPGAAVGSYQIAGANLTFTSPTVGNLVTAAGGLVTPIQSLVNGLAGPTGTIAGALNTLGLGGTVSASVTSSNLQSVVDGITGNFSSPSYPGITINLGTGLVTVDLNAITALNGRAANTPILNTTTIATIATRLTGLVLAYGQQVAAGLTAAINGITLTAAVTLPIVGPVLTINSTLGALIAGTTSGVSLVGLPLTIVGTLLTSLNGPTGALGAITTLVGGLAATVQAPVVSLVAPAINTVLAAALSITVNNQSTTGGVFRETGLRATLLPGTSALNLDLATATVGPNAIAPLVPPTVSGLTPTSGPVAGGTLVTITGSGLTGSTGATFGGVAGTGYTVVNATTATVTTPAHALGPVSVVVQSAAGPSGSLSYTYNPVPTITSLSPNHGPTAAGTAVTITGTGLLGSTGATFGGTAGTGYTVVSATTATVTAPAHAAGATTVSVQSPNGTTGTLPYTFDAAPAITALSPNNGPVAGGASVTITGTNLTGSTGAVFGGTAGTAYTVVNATTATVTTPAHLVGPVLVNVQSVNGASNALAYTFNAAPTITALSPDHGPFSGGTPVTITGTGLTGSTGASFGLTAGTAYTVVNDTTATVTAPAHLAGPTLVTIQSPNGLSGTLAYTFDPAPTIVALSPNSGPVAGGTSVTITGTGLIGSTGATFGGTAGTGYTVVNDTSATVTTPTNSLGAVSVVVQSVNGPSNALAYLYNPVPTITNLSPNHGPFGGGTPVTITGTGLTGATGALFGLTAGSSFTVVNDTTATVTSPAHLPGQTSVTIVSPNGLSSTLPFTFDPAPTVSSLSPNNGPIAGGTAVTITGTNLTGSTGATFGATPGTGYTVLNDTTATVTTPAHLAGPVLVTVASINGNANALPFTFNAAPTISALSPIHAPVAGGTTVTITGTGLSAATGATFGLTPGTNFTIINDTTATVTTPAHLAGSTLVTVQSLNGLSGTLPFTFDPAPTITSLSPNHGPFGGGTSVTITGTGLTGSTGATFGAPAGTVYTVVNDTTATVTTPASAAGTVSVAVQSPNGTSGTLPFTFDPAPAISSLTPTHGPVAGGTFVTITGTGLTWADSVYFGATPGTGLTVLSDTTVTVTAPAHIAGAVSVTVHSPNGTSGVLPYTFDPLPVTGSLAPNHGPEAGGTAVTITGTGLTGATGALFGSAPGIGFTVVNDTTATVTSPLHLAGAVSLTVQSPNGTSLGSTYTFDPAPVLNSLSPNHGTTDGGTLVTITGTGFTGSTGVLFGATAGTGFNVVDDTTVTVMSPAHAAGAVNVSIQSPNGTALALPYIYDQALVAPILTSLTPNHGPTAGGTSVTITGTGLIGSTGADFGLVAGTDYTVLSDTTATVTSPAHAAGSIDVTVQSPGGVSLPLPFTFDAVVVGAPVVTDISPDHGTLLGGTTVTITGTGLLGSTGAMFGLAAGTNYHVVSDLSATVDSPVHSPGPVSVVVLSPNGNSSPQSYLYDPLVPPAPAVTDLSPNHGPVDGGSSVTITGIGLTGSTGANFGSTSGATYTVVNDTTATVTVPAHAAGPVSVVVQSPNGVSNGSPYIYDAVPPVLSGLSPTHGSAAGGVLITISGTGLIGSTGALFGTTPGSSYTVVDDSTATVLSPVHAAGSVAVTVQSPNGTSSGLPFAFDPLAPTITSLSPTTGTAAGGTSVTITGTGLTGATGANFGTTPGTGFTVVNDTTATVTSPAHLVGSAAVTVLSPNGTSGSSPYLYSAAAPIITDVSPTHGSAAGGTAVTITGVGLTGATGAMFGTTAGTVFAVVNDTTATVTSPAGTAGVVQITVQGPGGSSLALPFVFDPLAPTITSIAPTTGTAAGGTAVTITGTGLTGATGATFGTTPGAGFTVVNDTTATVTSPSHAVGSASVTVQSPNGTSNGTAYVFSPLPPTITGLSPAAGSAGGGTTVTITGTGLTGSTGATFGVTAGTGYTVVSDTTATVTSPAGTVGTASVTIQSPNGTSAGSPFLYNPLPPTITSISPATGTAAGGTSVTITGTGLTGATGANFGTTPGSTFTVISDTAATVTTPAHAAGSVSVTIISPNGTSAGSPFVYSPLPPVITGLSPATGTAGGGTSVTITGTGLTGATGATFGTSAGTAFTVINDTTATVTTPAGTVGSQNFTVQSPNGSSLPLPYLYTAQVASLRSISPAVGPDTGGTLVTITGTGMSLAVEAMVDGVAGSDFTVIDDTTATVVTPVSAVRAFRRVALVVQMSTGVQVAMGFDYTSTSDPVVTDLTSSGTSGVAGDNVTAGEGDVHSVTAADSDLAYTGQDSGGIAFLALLLTLVGAGTVVTRRLIRLRNDRTVSTNRPISINRGEKK